MKKLIVLVGLVAGVVMPLWNIPLILRIRKRRSAQDLSLGWLFGVWGCIVAMLPSAILSSDQTFKIFGVVNAVLFSFVVVAVLFYRKKD